MISWEEELESVRIKCGHLNDAGKPKIQWAGRIIEDGEVVYQRTRKDRLDSVVGSYSGPIENS